MANLKFKVGGVWNQIVTIKGDKGDAGDALPVGGTAGQLLIKQSATDSDAIWQDNPTHDDRYYTETETNTLLAGKSDVAHTHDDRYYTETEIDATFAPKANPVFTGVVTASQIKFPATQVPSADPNTLDDYEEGTWTSNIWADAGAVTSFIGLYQRYTKIGNVVTIALSLQITDVGTAQGNLYFSLPFYCTYNASGSGRTINTGHALSIASGESNTGYALKYDASSPFGNYIYHISMTYISN